MIRTFFLTSLCSLFLAMPALAQEQIDANMSSVQLKGCDILIDFPNDPIVKSDCDEMGENCTHNLSYVKAFAGQATVSIDVLCKPGTQEEFDRYSKEEIGETLKQHAQFLGVERYNLNSAVLDANTKYAVLAGGIAAQSGNHDLAMTQLWITPKSFFTVEGLITGAGSEEIDVHFSRIMQSIRPKNPLKSNSAE